MVEVKRWDAAALNDMHLAVKVIVLDRQMSSVLIETLERPPPRRGIQINPNIIMNTPMQI